MATRMAEYHNPRSTLQIAGHPIHPMLIPFPIAFFIATFFCDVVFWFSGNSAWSTAAYYLLIAAVISTIVAALAGITEYRGDPKIRQLSAAKRHMIGNSIVLILAIINWYIRAGAQEEAVLPAGILLSFVIFLLLFYTGWQGGELVYRKRVAVADVAVAEENSENLP